MAYYMYILICVGNHMLSSAILDKSVEVNFSMGNQIACKNLIRFSFKSCLFRVMAHWFGCFCAVVGEVGVFPQGLASSFSNFLPHIIERLHSFSDGCRFIAVTSTLKLSDPTTPVIFPIPHSNCCVHR